MILELPVLNGSPYTLLGNSPKLNLFNSTRFTLTYNLNNLIIFTAVMPENYISGQDIIIKLFWFVRNITGTQNVQWKVAFQRLNDNSNLLNYTFNTEYAASVSVNTAYTQKVTTITVPLVALGGIVPGDLFRMSVKLSVADLNIPVDLSNVVLLNVP